MRNPTFSRTDAKKILRKTQKMFSFPRKKKISAKKVLSENDNIVVKQPVMLPFSNFSLVRLFNRISVVRSVRKQLTEMQLEKIILVTTVPNAAYFIGHCWENKVVYYCVDDFIKWPGHEKELVRQMEDELIEKTDVFIATSENLYKKLSIYGKPIHLLTHGVDLDHFSKYKGPEHHLLHDIPKPRVGYFGLFDDRSDKVLLAEVAKSLPSVSFVITGRVETDVSSLTSIKNVYFTGSVPYRELPAVVKGWEVCFLAYQVNDLTDAIQPLKIKEYLAAGKPVISTPIAEIKRLSKHVVYVASSIEEWEFAIQKALSEKKKDISQSTYALLENESWQKKANDLICII